MSGKAKHAARIRRSYHTNLNAARAHLNYCAVSNRIKTAKRRGGFLSNLFSFLSNIFSFLSNLFRRKVPNE